MRCVLDTSVAFKWVVDEDLADAARRFRQEFRAGTHDLLAPDVFPPELGHSLAKGERQGRLVDATGLWMDVLSTAPRFHPSLPLMPRALRIATQARIGVYDCLYVALAEREGCALLTADQKLVTNLQRVFPFITSLATLP